jgi:hypothetical protein
MAAWRAGDEDAAFVAFDCLARYTGDAPNGLVDAARLGRDLTDPTRTPQEMADQFFDLFPGRVVHIFNLHRGEVATELPSADRHGERGHAMTPLDPPTMTWLVHNDLFASAFRALQRGDLEEADQVFTEFLQRTKDEPSTSLRATVMLASRAIESHRSTHRNEPTQDRLLSQVLNSVKDCARSG